MKTSSFFLGAATVLGTSHAAHDAYLWTVDSGQVVANPNQVSSISNFAAERILTRRKGVTDSAYMHVTDENLLSDINQFGGWQRPLFDSDSSNHPPKVFIRISGYQGEVSEFNTLPTLWVEEPETTLLDSFEAEFNVKNLCEYHIKPRMRSDVSIKYTYFEEDKACLPQHEVEMFPSVLAISATVPHPDKLAGTGISSFHRTLLHLAAIDHLESTLLVLPNASKLKSPKKTELKKRAEQPLDLPTPSPESINLSTAKNSSNFTLPRNIPQYFSSESSCVNITNSCVGHGKCVKAHGGQYRCKCSSTIVRTNKDGSTKSVQWGGNACQKKDVSTEFILFASFGIFFTAVIAGAIGLLFSMGAEELPSVIGAGVVGPRAQR